jgi:hypothetical protein
MSGSLFVPNHSPGGCHTVNRHTAWIVWAAAATVIGCGPAADTPYPRSNLMSQLGNLIQAHADEKKKPPTHLDDLLAYEPMSPGAFAAVRDGDVVLAWKTPMAAGSQKVVAYEKDVPDKGGLVLRQDGQVVTMSAQEFKQSQAGR